MLNRVPSKLLNATRNKVYYLLPKRCIRDEKGVAAVEFALIVPILLLMFLGTMEISLAVAVDRKISRISSSVGDLIAQGQTFNKAQLDAIADISARIMDPYDDEVNISIVGIEIDKGVAKVAWAHPIGTAAKPAKGSVFAVPESIKTDGTFLLSATVSTDHEPAVAFLGFDGKALSFDDTAIEIEEQMFLRPRASGGIVCTDC